MTISVFDAARERPDGVALVWDGRASTWSRLADETRRACAWLVGRGLSVGDGARLAFVARRSPDAVVLLYAAMAAGWSVVPLHPRLTEEERNRALVRLSPALVIDDVGAWRAHDGVLEPAVEHDPELPLAIVHTSGSSGAPRGVVLSRRAFEAAAIASAANLGVREDDRWLLAMPLAHVGGLSIPIRMLHGRGCTALSPEGSFDAARFCAALDRSEATLASVVPTMLRRIVALDATPLPSLRALLVGGAAASPELLAAARARGLPVLATYGLTEACAQVATQSPGEAVVGVGRPLAGTEVRIVDGEVQVRGPTLLSGVVGGPDPRTPDGWLQTGDAGRLDGVGVLHVDGRLDDLIVTGGENVWPAEVERALEAQPGVREACVFGAPDPEWGTAVLAAVAGDVDEDALGSALREMLASHKLPRRIHVLTELPRTPSGKLDRTATAVAVGG